MARNFSGVYDLQKQLDETDLYRQVLVTGKFAQVVLNHLKDDEFIHMETHHGDQILIISEGTGVLKFSKFNKQKNKYEDFVSTCFKKGDMLFIESGTKHEIQKTSLELTILSIYSPPQHEYNKVQETMPEND